MLVSCSESIYLFNAEISSEDINGTKCFGPKNSSSISKLIKDPLLIEPEFENLGRLISSKNLKDDNAFLNFIFLKGNYGVLDSIYISYLQESVIPNYSQQSNFTIEEWNKFKENFDDASTYSKKKQILFQNEYFLIRKYLEKSVYRVIQNSIVQNHKLESIFKSGLQNNLEAVLKEKNVEASLSLKAKLEELIKSNIAIIGKYSDIELKKDFVDKLKILLTRLKITKPTGLENDFTLNYKTRFLENKDFVAIGYSLLQFEIIYNTSKINRTDIEAIIEGTTSLSASQQTELTDKVYANFSVTSDFKGEAKSIKNYLVRYSYDSSIQELNN